MEREYNSNNVNSDNFNQTMQGYFNFALNFAEGNNRFYRWAIKLFKKWSKICEGYNDNGRC